jgi:hypothetical protein
VRLERICEWGSQHVQSSARGRPPTGPTSIQSWHSRREFRCELGFSEYPSESVSVFRGLRDGVRMKGTSAMHGKCPEADMTGMRTWNLELDGAALSTD